MSVMLLFVLMWLSFIGYGFYLHYRFSFPPAVIPLFVFSSVVAVVFIAGLMDVLRPAVYGIWSIGLILFVYAGYRIIKKRLFTSLITPGLVFFTAMCGFFLVLLKDAVFLHFDNFSHWGIIVKHLFLYDSLPGDASVITYKNYPPGTALFVYYIVTLIGFSETKALMAQSFLVAAALTPLFLFTSWKRPLLLIVVTAAAFVLLLIDAASIYTLLVDQILGYMTIAVMLIVFYYRNHVRLMMAAAAPVLALLVLTKDSGKIFFAFCVVWIIAVVIKNRQSLQGKAGQVLSMFVLLVLAFPLLVNGLWSSYIERAYTSDYEENKFAITKETFLDPNKSDEVVQQLWPNVLSQAFDMSVDVIQVMTVVSIAAILTFVWSAFVKKRSPRALLFTTLFVHLFYVVYIGLLYLLYLYLMPEGEAANLAGFSRYQATAGVFFTGLLLVMLLREWQKISYDGGRAWFSKAMMAGCAVVAMLPLLNNIPALLQQHNPGAEPRYPALEQYYALTDAEKITGDTKITLIRDTGESDHGFLRHAMNYERMAKTTFVHTMCQTEEEKEKLQEDVKESDYLIVLKNTEEMNECLAEVNQAGPLEPGNYLIEEGVIMTKVTP
ncbi:hypothetical protein SAMN05192534_102103 [Alteribacillus persepolensis]|uniref:Dolichyl-phosphate-mannose-protein mannosyltransferase n=1 Tax=Alteribacillus persepolensis TaxID=568899 RepID=A0A1G8AC17_9BACI|nr:hypothetical protein [Alteribacillus persepolensis]SDH18492.1 hypothetical protein SAMN05192534_102103 [Alteribacillus persepolensis]